MQMAKNCLHAEAVPAMRRFSSVPKRSRIPGMECAPCNCLLEAGLVDPPRNPTLDWGVRYDIG